MAALLDVYQARVDRVLDRLATAPERRAHAHQQLCRLAFVHPKDQAWRVQYWHWYAEWQSAQALCRAMEPAA